MAWVRLLKPWGNLGTGSIIDINPDLAYVLTEKKTAVPVASSDVAAPSPQRETAVKGPHETR